MKAARGQGSQVKTAGTSQANGGATEPDETPAAGVARADEEKSGTNEASGRESAQGTFTGTFIGRSTAWIVVWTMVISLLPMMVLLMLSQSYGQLETPSFMIPYLAAWALGMTAGIVEPLYRVRVGSDGILVKRRPWSRQYIPFAELADAVEVDERVLRLIYHSGKCVDLFWAERTVVSWKGYNEKCQTLLAQIKEGIARAREQNAGRGAMISDRAQALLRREQPSRKVPYRELPPPGEQELLELVETATGRASTRAAAAVVLSRQGDEKVRQRLRIAADATVHPQLKHCLRIAADQSDEAELEAAIEEVVAQSRTARNDVA